MTSSVLMTWVFSRFWLKLTSLTVAVLLWLFVQGKEMLDVSSTVRLKLVAPEGLTMTGDEIVVKDVTIRGPRALVESYDETPIGATMVLPTDKGVKRFRVEKQHFDEKWDPRSTIIIHEPYFNVEIEEMVSRTLPITVVLRGHPKEGYFVERTRALPSNVTVSGARSNLESLSEISTLPLDISDLSQDLTQEVSLDVPTRVKFLYSDYQTIVTVYVAMEQSEQMFAEVPLQVRETSLLARLMPEVVSVLVRGSPQVLERVIADGVQAYVVAQELQAGTFELPVQVQLPAEVSLLEVVPQTVAVTLQQP